MLCVCLSDFHFTAKNEIKCRKVAGPALSCPSKDIFSSVPLSKPHFEISSTDPNVFNDKTVGTVGLSLARTRASQAHR